MWYGLLIPLGGGGDLNEMQWFDRTASGLNGVTTTLIAISLALQLWGQQSLQTKPRCQAVNKEYATVTDYTALACGDDGAFAANVAAPWNTTTTCIEDLYDADFSHLFAAYFMTALLLVWEVARRFHAELIKKPRDGKPGKDGKPARPKEISGDTLITYFSASTDDALRKEDLAFDVIAIGLHLVAAVFVLLAWERVSKTSITGVPTSECYTHHTSNGLKYLFAFILYLLAVVAQLYDIVANRENPPSEKNAPDVQNEVQRPRILQLPTNVSSCLKAACAFGVLVVSAIVSRSQLNPTKRCEDEDALLFTNVLTVYAVATFMFACRGLEEVKDKKIVDKTQLNRAYFPLVLVALLQCLLTHGGDTGMGIANCQTDSPPAAKEYVNVVFYQVIVILALVMGVPKTKLKTTDFGGYSRSNAQGLDAPESYARPPTSRTDMQTLRLTHDGPDKKASSLSFV